MPSKSSRVLWKENRRAFEDVFVRLLTELDTFGFQTLCILPKDHFLPSREDLEDLKDILSTSFL